MEVFKSNKKNKKWYEKVNLFKLLLVFILSLIIFFLFFYYIGNSNNLDKSIITSIVIAILLSLYNIFNDLIENRDRIFLLDDDKLAYIEIHKEISGKFLSSIDFENIVENNKIEDIYKKNDLYEGIDRGIILNILSVKKKSNRIILKVKTDAKEWKSTSKIFITNVYLVNKNYIRKIVIPNDYDNYNKLYNLINKQM